MLDLGTTTESMRTFVLPGRDHLTLPFSISMGWLRSDLIHVSHPGGGLSFLSDITHAQS